MTDRSDQEGERSSDEDDGLDPRIKSELESLNSAAESINKLENELQRAKNKFRQVKAESSHRLGVLYKKIGKKWVLKARPYYELLRQSTKAQLEAQKSAAKFQRANGIYRAAKETVTLAEQRLFEGGGTIAFDSAWQEMLNHATAKFMDAEKEKTACEVEHQSKAGEYAAIQQRLAFLLKDIPRTINKAKPFYDLKDRLESRLHMERQNAEDLQLALVCSKQKYRLALSSLEAISDHVHMQRELRRRRLELPLRTPGVGAELDSDLSSELSDMPSASLDVMSETGSQVSWDDFSDSRCVSPALSIDFDINDPSWADLATSPDSAFTSPSDQSVDAPSVWTRLGTGFSRITAEIGRIPTAPAISGSSGRDDIVEGAESEDTKAGENSSGYSGGWSLPDSFRSTSSSNFPHSSSSVFEAGQSTGIGNWISARPVFPTSYSSDSVASSDVRKQETFEVEKPSVIVQKPVAEKPSIVPFAEIQSQNAQVLDSAVTDDEKLSAEAQRSLRLDDSWKNPDADMGSPVEALPKFTSVLNHSFQGSAFSQPHNRRSLSVTSAAPVQPSTSGPSTVESVQSPPRLTSKPPRPTHQRSASGNVSPRDATLAAASLFPWKRTADLKATPPPPRNSLLYQSASAGKPAVSRDLPRRSESTSDLQSSATRRLSSSDVVKTNNNDNDAPTVADHQEIFV